MNKRTIIIIIIIIIIIAKFGTYCYVRNMAIYIFMF